MKLDPTSRVVSGAQAVVAIAIAIGALVAIASSGCKRSPEITCRVNDQCFVCPDEKAKTACKRDPTSSRCKWIEMSHCQQP